MGLLAMKSWAGLGGNGALLRRVGRSARLTSWIACCLCALMALPVSGASTPLSARYFGMHIFYPHLDTKWPVVPFGSLRVWDTPGTTWADIEPVQGQMKFASLDRIVDLASAHHVSVLYTLGQTPAWASKRPFEGASRGSGRAAEPRDLADWEAYVRAVATRYRGRIQAYEIWNEPRFNDLYPWRNAGFFSGSAESMVSLSRVAYRVIKEVDPSAIVVSPAMDGESHGLKKFDLFLKKGGGNWFDVVGWHFYLLSSTRPEALVAHHRDIRKLLALHGLSQKPIWNTETGVLVNYGKPVKPMDSVGILSKVMSPAEATNYMVRAMTMLAGEGIERFYWFAWDSGSMGMLSALQPRNPSEIAYAYGALDRWLVGAQIEPCRLVADGVWGCRVQRGGRDAHIVWSANGNRLFAIPAAWQVSATQALLGGSESIAGTSTVVGERPVLLKAEFDDWNTIN